MGTVNGITSSLLSQLKYYIEEFSGTLGCEHPHTNINVYACLWNDDNNAAEAKFHVNYT